MGAWDSAYNVMELLGGGDGGDGHDDGSVEQAREGVWSDVRGGG